MIEKPISEARYIAKSTVPKLKSQVVYKIAPNSDWVKAIVYSRAGKAGGKFGSFFNVTSGKDEIWWLDFKTYLTDWEPITQNEPTEIVLFMKDEIFETEKDAVDNAKVTELINWKNNQVHTHVVQDFYKIGSYNKSYWRRQNYQSKICYQRLCRWRNPMVYHWFSNVVEEKLVYQFWQ